MRHHFTDRSVSLFDVAIRDVQTGLIGAMFIVAAGACSSKDAAKTDTNNATPSAMSPATGAPAADSAAKGPNATSGMASMAMPGDPDHDFLRMMTDHHKGLILLAHETIESKEKFGVTPIAERLDKEQDAEMDTMNTMLEKTFKDPYAPKVMPEHQGMADELKTKTGADYDRTFLQSVIKHHQEAVKMIDDYLPTAKMPAIKAMAAKMKATQTNEIAEFQKRLAK